jgi:hypothetical protein
MLASDTINDMSRNSLFALGPTISPFMNPTGVFTKNQNPAVKINSYAPTMKYST